MFELSINYQASYMHILKNFIIKERTKSFTITCISSSAMPLSRIAEYFAHQNILIIGS